MANKHGLPPFMKSGLECQRNEMDVDGFRPTEELQGKINGVLEMCHKTLCF